MPIYHIQLVSEYIDHHWYAVEARDQEHAEKLADLIHTNAELRDKYFVCQEGLTEDYADNTYVGIVEVADSEARYSSESSDIIGPGDFEEHY